MGDDENTLVEAAALEPFPREQSPWREQLKSYGGVSTSMQMQVRLLQVDLNNSASKMKSKSTSEEWHSATAEYFSVCMDEEGKSSKLLKQLPILPLRTGDWVSADSGPVYFPTADGVPIPSDVDMRILDPGAVANAKRKQFFIQLGVTEPAASSVRGFLSDAYCSPTRRISLEESRAHLHFLYLTHNLGQPGNALRNIQIHSQDRGIQDPRQVDFYLPGGDHPYGPESLLAPTDKAPGLRVVFLHEAYLEKAPKQPVSTHPSWKTWLCDNVGVRKSLRLVTRHGDALSDSWGYVAKYQPKKLLGMLEYLWTYEGPRVITSNKLKDAIQQTRASEPCDVPNYPGRLCDTFLPLPHLQNQRLRFMEKSEPFPFLTFANEEKVSEVDFYFRWLFLSINFNVRTNDDILFLLTLLACISRVDPKVGLVSRFRRVLDLYAAIHKKYIGLVRSSDQQVAKEVIK